MAKINQLKLAFYGDDFTGSTDAMEALVLGGVPTVLFLQPPSRELVERKFPHVEAVGLAGMSRTMTPAQMDASLPGAFTSLRDLGAPVMHYKVCSTFDSSPEIGNIGHAAEIGMDVFKTPMVPVAVGAPKLKRFVVFGNHFATMGDITYRLDRHPVMSKHPITPMTESDLRLHLAKQTDRRIGLLDIRHLALPDPEIDAYLQSMLNEGVELLILDTLDRSHLKKVARIVWSQGQQHQAFVVGSSGVEFALVELWQEEQLIQPPRSFISPGPVDKLVAVSGSASPWTSSQIQWALEHGFQGIRMQSASLVDPALQYAERCRLVDQATQVLNQGKSVLLYSALGPDDPQVVRTRARAHELGLAANAVGEVLGIQQGLILQEILVATGVRRAAVAGGDTCGYVAKQLSLYVLEFVVPCGVAAPLCRASSNDPRFDGIEIALKGGQLGEVDFFGTVLSGGQNQPIIPGKA